MSNPENAPDNCRALEAQLRESEERCRRLMDFSPDALIVHSDGTIKYANDAAVSLLGAENDHQLIGKPFMTFVHPDYREAVARQFIDLQNKKHSQLLDQKLVRLDGTVIYAETVGVSINCHGLPAVQTIVRDITARRQVQEEQRMNSLLLKALSSAQSQFIADADPREFFNSLLSNLLLLTQSEYGYIGEVLYTAKGEPYLKIHATTNIAWDDDTRSFYHAHAPAGIEFHNLKTLFGAVMTGGKPLISNSPATDPERGGLPPGHPPLKAFLGIPFFRGSRMVGMVGIANRPRGYDHEIIEYLTPFLSTCANCIEAYRSERMHKQTVQALQKSEQMLRDIAASLAEGIYVLDRSGQITFMNEEAERLLGWKRSELSCKNVHDVFHFRRADGSALPFADCPVRKVIENGNRFFSSDEVFVRKDGTVFPISVLSSPIIENGTVVASVTAFRDITERKNLEQELLTAQKLESVGILAGGIAHDFNNLLMGIMGYISFAKMQLSTHDKAFRLLDDAERACVRAGDLTKQLLTFSKGGEPIMKETSVRELVHSAMRFALSGSNISSTVILSDNLWNIEADEGQISQVLHNMALNAREAMPQGGTITVSAENVELKGKEGIRLKNGPYIKMSVQDHGTGIRKEHLGRIFDPYFTTKEMGSKKGMGLGLTVCYSIIKKHNGLITVESERGSGTKFNIYIPAKPKKAHQAETVAASHTDRRRVLVMDDEEMVRDITGEFLGYLGYKVVYARDGEEAIASYRKAIEAGEGFDAVILDLTIPGGMGGKETVRHLITLDPAVRAIATSGYQHDPIMTDFTEHGFKAVIAKPYRIEDLNKTLSALFARTS